MSEPLNLLIVEDDASIVYIIKIELSAYGFDVKETHVENAYQMKMALRKKKFDVIISDHHMPSFSSIDALFIRNEFCWETPFLIYTNCMPEKIRSMAIREGCNMVLEKEDVFQLPKVIEQLICETKKIIE